MALNSSNRSVVAERRRKVAFLLTHRPGITQQEIANALASEQHVNQATGKPWSVATINGDVAALDAQWRREAGQDMASAKAQSLARTYEIQAVAWREKRYDLALKCEERIAKLLGLDAPTRQEIAGDMTMRGPVALLPEPTEG